MTTPRLFREDAVPVGGAHAGVRSWLWRKFGVLVLLAAGSRTGAQTVAGRAAATEAGSPELEARCARAAATLLSDTAASAPAWVYGAIGQCEVSGPDAIAHAWGVVRGDDQEQLNALLRSSRAIRDARIFEAERTALGGIWGGPPRADAVRLAAINALVGYAVPDAAPYPLSAGPPAYIVRVTDAPAPVVGGQPLMDDVLGNVQFILAVASGAVFGPSPGPAPGGSSDPSTVAGRAALALQALSAVKEAQAATPVPGAVSLTALCGTQFRITSRQPRPLQLQYTVDGSGLPPAEVGVPAYGQTVFTAPVAGTVRLTYPGVLLATVPSSSQACQ